MVKKKKYGIALISIIPIRKEPSDASEMTSQMLFGEVYEIMETTPDWYKIVNLYDNDSGWMDKKMFTGIDQEDFANNSSAYILTSPYAQIESVSDHVKQNIVAGSVLFNFNESKKAFSISTHKYKIISQLKPSEISDNIRENILHTTQIYMHAPYLWGGKTPFGIDCSGFTQMVYKINSLILPRNAQQQYEVIKDDVSLINALPGSLAFFSKGDKKVSHVGILIGNTQIIHASGHVRVDFIDRKGIYNNELKKHTHFLLAIKNSL